MPKLTIQFDDSVNKLLNELADKKHTTKAEIIRRALATYKYLNDEIDKGDKQISVTSAKTETILKDVLLP